MKLGYITFSSEEQQLVHTVIQQTTQGAIDEIGLGRIRDTFSDAMFPGMSTLHRKSKYFVLLPALYNQLAEMQIEDKSKIPTLIRQYEITMTISLLNAVDGDSDNTGITGSSLGVRGLQEGKFVKITPTSIYLSSLKYFGMVSEGMNINDLIYQQSLNNRKLNPTKRRTKDEIAEDPDGTDATTNHDPYFFPFTGYDFSTEGLISLKLTNEEASILRSHIINKCRTDKVDNLYSYLLDHDEVKIEPEFFKMKDVIDRLPEKQYELKRVYHLAYDFANWAHLMNTYYRLAFYLKTHNETRVIALREHIDAMLKARAYPSTERIAEILAYVKQSPNFHDTNSVCKFCMEASQLLGRADSENQLLSLISNRERSIKGRYYKIGNTRYKNFDFGGDASYYTYRWNDIVYSMINDIRNPEQ